MPATKITTPDKSQVKPYEAPNWNAQDANNHRKAINDHAAQLDKLVGADGLVLAQALPAFTEADATTILGLVQAQLDTQYVRVPAPRTPPSSYSETLSASKTQVEGITADIGGTQLLRVNPIAGVSGANLVLQLVDSSDNNRVSQFGFVSGNAGEFYQFQKKDGSTYEATFPSNDQTISV